MPEKRNKQFKEYYDIDEYSIFKSSLVEGEEEEKLTMNVC